MDIKAIKEIILSDNPLEIKEHLIINILAKDPKVIPTILKILNNEREGQKELILDMNLELSRADVFIGLNQKKRSDFDKDFIQGEIQSFYNKHKDSVTHCFNKYQK